MNSINFQELAQDSLAGVLPKREILRNILRGQQIELLSLINAAYDVRRHFFGNEVMIHVINNVQNGYCPEDCHYCAQAKTAKTDIEAYAVKPDEEILEEARRAFESGAFRYCMVYAGRGPSQERVKKLAELIRAIKSRFPIEVCVSAGLLNIEKARVLKEAGLDRLNHNLNTSAHHYPKICTTHTYQDRLDTLHAAREAELEICSGIIVGMGEDADDIIETALTLRKFDARSIPVNFLIPLAGTSLAETSSLSPEYCLRILCLFRFIHPNSEIRIAAGREVHLRSLQVLGLYPANSLFLDGYLNAKGGAPQQTLQMIKDAGFTIKSEQNLESLLTEKTADLSREETQTIELKKWKDLRPQYKSAIK